MVSVARVNTKNTSLVTALHSLMKVELLNECYIPVRIFPVSIFGTI